MNAPLLDWNDPTLTVTGTTTASRVAPRGHAHGDGPLVLTRDDLEAVTFKKASALVNGNLVITTKDGARCQLHFRRKQRDEFRDLEAALGATGL
ncbi:hypothetical protein ACQPYH_06200 [Kribbella sp. CA-245084]|uniref:hypothetical protein n=1 Tax=Kribbella sp. CA-245084 TaxID=3239940 RepID=UPI003D8E5713